MVLKRNWFWTTFWKFLQGRIEIRTIEEGSFYKNEKKSPKCQLRMFPRSREFYIKGAAARVLH